MCVSARSRRREGRFSIASFEDLRRGSGRGRGRVKVARPEGSAFRLGAAWIRAARPCGGAAVVVRAPGSWPSKSPPPSARGSCKGHRARPTRMETKHASAVAPRLREATARPGRSLRRRPVEPLRSLRRDFALSSAGHSQSPARRPRATAGAGRRPPCVEQTESVWWPVRADSVPPAGRGIPARCVAPYSNTGQYSRSSRLAIRAPRSGNRYRLSADRPLARKPARTPVLSGFLRFWQLPEVAGSQLRWSVRLARFTSVRRMADPTSMASSAEAEARQLE